MPPVPLEFPQCGTYPTGMGSSLDVYETTTIALVCFSGALLLRLLIVILDHSYHRGRNWIKCYSTTHTYTWPSTKGLQKLPNWEGIAFEMEAPHQIGCTSAVVDTSTQHQSTVMEGQLALVLQCEVSDYWPTNRRVALSAFPSDIATALHNTLITLGLPPSAAKCKTLPPSLDTRPFTVAKWQHCAAGWSALPYWPTTVDFSAPSCSSRRTVCLWPFLKQHNEEEYDHLLFPFYCSQTFQDVNTFSIASACRNMCYMF